MQFVEAVRAGARPPRLNPVGIARFVRANVLLSLAMFVLGAMILLAFVGSSIAPFDPEKPNPRAFLLAPSSTHIFGTDDKGFDIFSRTISAPKTDLTIALAATAIGFGFGSLLGLLAGYGSGRGRIAGSLAELLTRFMDIVQSFPIFIVALALVGVLGAGTRQVIEVLAILFTPIFFRYVRAEVLLVRELTFIEAERAVGNPVRRLMFHHVLPNSVTTATVQASAVIGYGILLTAGLSFVGAGVRPPTPEWGSMIKSGAEQMIAGKWWASVFPGIAVGFTVFSLAIVGEAVRIRWRGAGLSAF